MASEEQRRLVWQGLLTADYHARYYGRLASKLDRREKWIALAAALGSSLALASLVADIPIPYFPEVLSFVVFGLSLYLAFARVGRTAMLSSWQYAKWSRLEAQYERLWKRLTDMPEEEIEEEWWQLVEKSCEGSDTMPIEFPEKARLSRRCQQEAIRARTGQGTEAA